MSAGHALRGVCRDGSGGQAVRGQADFTMGAAGPWRERCFEELPAPTSPFVTLQKCTPSGTYSPASGALQLQLYVGIIWKL